jgi:hypothetical protein
VKSFMLSGSKTQRLPRFLTREKAADSYPCSQNIVRQPITARKSVLPWDLYTVPAKNSHSGNWNPLNFILFEVFSMRVFVNALVLLSSNWKTTVWVFICIAWQRRPLTDPDRVSTFPSKMNGCHSTMRF